MKRFLLLLIFLQATIALGVDINGPLVRAGLENKSSDPSTTLTGRVYWNTANKKARIWDGSAWGDFGTGGGASAAYTVSPTAVTAVGTAGMPKLGHLVDANDFGGATTSQYSYWPLSANANDGNTTGARNLSPSVAISYTTTNILGTTNAAATLDGSTQYYSLANAYFNAGGNATKSFAYGGWFYKSSWSAGGKIALSVGNNTDMASRIYLTSVGGLQIDMYTSSGTNADAANPGPTNSALTAGWHHLAALYDAPNNVFYGLIDGKENYHFTPTAAVRSTTGTATFHVGRAPDLSSSFYWPGAVEDVFFIAGSYTPTVEDIRKLASRRFDHNLAIGPESQLWLVNAARSDNYVTNQDTSGALVSKDNNRAWMDFSGFATGSYVSAKMLNTQSSLTSVPQGSYDSGYLSSTPITTIPHGLGDVPAAVVVYYETTTNRFTPLMGSNFCETDATNLYCDWTGLTVAAGSRVRIQAWSTGSMSAITAASASQSGIVNTTTQTLAGVKTFQDGAVIKGVAANSSAATGYVGEIVECSTSSNPPASATWWDVCLMTLSAGDWDVVGSATFRANGATFTSTDLDVAAGGTSGTTVTGVSIPYSQWLIQAAVPNSFAYASIPIGPIKVRSDGSLIYIGPNSYSGQILYIKGNMSVYTSGTPAIYVYVRARRVR